VHRKREYEAGRDNNLSNRILPNCSVFRARTQLARQGKARQGKAGQGRQGRLKIHEKAIGVYADAVAAVNSFHT
jgi:hypothetical protein